MELRSSLKRPRRLSDEDLKHVTISRHSTEEAVQHESPDGSGSEISELDVTENLPQNGKYRPSNPDLYQSEDLAHLRLAKFDKKTHALLKGQGVTSANTTNPPQQRKVGRPRRNVVGQGKFHCKVCNRWIARRDALARHKQCTMHRKNLKNQGLSATPAERGRPHVCRTCDRDYRSQKSLDKHRRSAGHIMRVKIAGKEDIYPVPKNVAGEEDPESFVTLDEEDSEDKDSVDEDSIGQAEPDDSTDDEDEQPPRKRRVTSYTFERSEAASHPVSSVSSPYPSSPKKGASINAEEAHIEDGTAQIAARSPATEDRTVEDSSSRSWIDRAKEAGSRVSNMFTTLW